MNGRAMEALTNKHLSYLGGVARLDREGLFARRPYLTSHRDLIICVALCQGGALHWIDGKNGVNDLDVYTFYAEGGEKPYPPWRRAQMSYVDSGLVDWSEKVDLMGRSIRHAVGDDPANSVVSYLSKPRTATAWHLSQTAVVLIEPTDRIGEIVWPVGACRAR